MRFLVLLMLVAGCPVSSKDDAEPTSFSGDAGVGNGAVPDPAVPCDDDNQCALAGATCCSCPSFAVAANDPGLKSCGSINCPMMDCPTNLRAACTNNTCQVACVATTCSATCAAGFAADASGCLTCDCFQPTTDSCAKDADCVEVGADCCGCARGGSDTAVLASQVNNYTNNLACPNNPQCPETNTCTPNLSPHCTQGACVLATPDPVPANACGRPDLMPCPSGQVCVVNSNSSADRLGVGICTPQ